MAWPNPLRTSDGVVHANGFTMAMRCRGQVVFGEYEFVDNDVAITCLWCVAGAQAPSLTWVLPWRDAHD